jgi:4-amino-4-deoxy-L-arabinose transferase-like glycosyltransferase
LLAALVTFSVLGGWRYGRDGHWLALLGGAVCFGLGLLTKFTAWLIAPVVVVAIAGFGVASPSQRRRLVGLLVFFAVALLVVLPWYVTVQRAYGTPFFWPRQPGISRTVEWFAQLKAKPWYTYLLGVPAQVPLFVVGYATIGWLIRRRETATGPWLVAGWWLIWLVALTWQVRHDEILGPEHRYLLPALPALAVLTALGWQGLIERARQRGWLRPALAATVVALLLQAGWSLWLLGRFRAYDDIPWPW